MTGPAVATSYVRQLEDACLILFDRLTPQEFVNLRKEIPGLADFVAHLNHSVTHEEAMVRRNVWAG